MNIQMQIESAEWLNGVVMFDLYSLWAWIQHIPNIIQSNQTPLNAHIIYLKMFNINK